MQTKIPLTMLAALTILIVCAVPATAQIIHGQPVAGQTSVVYNHWKVESDTEEATLTQFMIPVMAFVPVRDNFELTFYSANSSNNLKGLGQEFDLNGLGDVRLQANHSFMGDQLLLSAGVNLPTGKKELARIDEMLVLQAMSLNFVNIPMRRLGEGFGFNILLGGAAVLAEGVRGGAGIMYDYVGEYKPYESAVEGRGDYDPGNKFSLNAGVDFEFDNNFWSLNAIYSIFSTDKYDGTESFKQSPQLDLRASVVTGQDGASFNGLVRYVIRGKNGDYSALGVELPAFKLFGNELSLAGGADFPIGEKLHVRPMADLRFIADNDLEFGGSTVFGFGSDVGMSLSENYNASAGIKLYTGHAADGDIDLSGYQLTFGLSASM